MTQATEPELGAGAGAGGDGALDVTVEHLRSLLDDSVDLAAVLDLSGRVHYLNRAGWRILGLPGEVKSTVLAPELLVEDDRRLIDEEVVPALRSAGMWSGNLTLTTNGIETPVRATLRTLVRSGDEPHVLSLIARDISTEKRVFERLHRTVFEDELTGLPHRSMFLDRLDLALRRHPSDAAGVVLLFVSLDRFKEKNDRFGREAGDHLLQAVGHRLAAAWGPEDTASRWGGDEFVYLCEADPEGLDAMAVATRVADVFAAPFELDGIELFQSASIGAAIARSGEMTPDQLLRHAEAAGQMAKRRGGEAIHLFDEEMAARALRRAEIEDALRGAADRGELILHYQPEVSLLTNEIVGTEALIRWRHPHWGLVAPTEFIPVAEASSLILDVGGFVLRAAMEQCAQWRTLLGERSPMVAINISPRQFVQDDFASLVASCLEATGADASDICLEITESVLMRDIDVAVATLRRLKALGVHLAIDDFGTGYSSLSYLRAFPIDILKVDQSFVSGLGKDPEDSAIVEAVVRMGQALRLTTVAEGVETAHHLIELRELQCDIAQGYHFARPADAESVTQMLLAGPDWLD